MEMNKNMTAQDMFFNLGFKLVESDDDFLLYKKHTELDNTLISFDTKTKSIYSELIDGEYGSPEPIVLTFCFVFFILPYKRYRKRTNIICRSIFE